MRLYLMQHGKAKSKEEDPSRSLTFEGRAEVERVTAFLARTGSCEGLTVRHSGKTRARETAEALATAFDGATVEESDGLGPMDDPDIWVDRLAATNEGAVLVGHVPHLARLASLLLAGDPDRGVVRFANGGVLCLERSEDRQWALVWSVVPELLA